MGFMGSVLGFNADGKLCEHIIRPWDLCSSSLRAGFGVEIRVARCFCAPVSTPLLGCFQQSVNSWDVGTQTERGPCVPKTGVSSFFKSLPELKLISIDKAYQMLK